MDGLTRLDCHSPRLQKKDNTAAGGSIRLSKTKSDRIRTRPLTLQLVCYATHTHTKTDLRLRITIHLHTLNRPRLIHPAASSFPFASRPLSLLSLPFPFISSPSHLPGPRQLPISPLHRVRKDQTLSWPPVISLSIAVPRLIRIDNDCQPFDLQVFRLLILSA